MVEQQLQQIGEKLNDIEGKLTDLNDKSVNGWEKASVILGVLTPLTIGGLGYYLNSEIGRREAAQSAERFQQELVRSEKRDWVARIALIPSFVDALTDGSEKKQLLAVRTINAVLPVDGPKLLAGILDEEGADLSQQVRDEAKAELSQGVRSLVVGMYSADQGTRIASYNALNNGGISPLLIVPELLSYGQENTSNLDGAFNSLTLIKSNIDNSWKPLLRSGAIDPKSIEVFAEAVRPNGERTDALATAVIDALPK